MYQSPHQISHTASNSKQELQPGNMVTCFNETVLQQSTCGSLMRHQGITRKETPKTSELPTQFHDELKKFTSKVVGLEKHAPAPMDRSEIQASYLVKASQPMATQLVSSAPTFNRVRTRPSWHSERNVKEIDVSNFSWAKRSSSTDDSVGQICVERVYFAADQGKTLGNSHGSTSHLIEQCTKDISLSPVGESNGCYTKPIGDDNHLVETNGNMLPDESSEMDRPGLFCSVTRTKLSSSGDNIMNVPPVNRDPSPFTTWKDRSKIGNALHHEKYTSYHAFSDTSRLIGSQASSANTFSQADSTYIGHNASEYTSTVDTSDHFYEHETLYQFERAAAWPVSNALYTAQHSNLFPATTKRRSRSTDTFLERTNDYNLRYGNMQAHTDPQFRTMPTYYGRATRHLSFPMSDQDQRILDNRRRIQGNRQLNEVEFASYQQPNHPPNSRGSPRFQFYTYSGQSPSPSETGFYYQQKPGSSTQHPIQYWLEIDRPLTVAGQFNVHENQSSVTQTADSISPKTQTTDHPVLHSYHVTETSDNGVVTSPRNNDCCSNIYFVPSCSQTNPPGHFAVNEEAMVNGTSLDRKHSNKFGNTKEQKTDVKNPRKQNLTSIRRCLPSSQVVPLRNETETASEFHQPFVTQRFVQIERNEQKDCLYKPEKVDANIQVTSSNACVKRSKATQVTQGTQTNVLTPVTRPSVHVKENFSRASRLTQDINNSYISQNNQNTASTKRKAEGSDPVKKKRMRRKNVPVDQDFLVYQSGDISSTTDQFPEKLAFESHSFRATKNHPTSPCEHEAKICTSATTTRNHPASPSEKATRNYTTASTTTVHPTSPREHFVRNYTTALTTTIYPTSPSENDARSYTTASTTKTYPTSPSELASRSYTTVSTTKTYLTSPSEHFVRNYTTALTTTTYPTSPSENDARSYITASTTKTYPTGPSELASRSYTNTLATKTHPTSPCEQAARSYTTTLTTKTHPTSLCEHAPRSYSTASTTSPSGSIASQYLLLQSPNCFTAHKATQSTNCFNESAHYTNSSKTPSPKQTCTIAIQCTLPKASPQATTGKVPPIEQVRIARDGTSWQTLQETSSKQANCPIQHQKSGLTPIHRVENATAAYFNPLKQTRYQEVQVCNGKEYSKSFSSRNAATMTSPLHLNQSHDGVLDQVEEKSELPQTNSGSNTLSRNRLQVSKCVEAKLDSRKSPSGNVINQSCQANIDTAPCFNLRYSVARSRDNESLCVDRGSSSHMVFVSPDEPYTFISSPQSEPMSQCTTNSRASRQRCNVDPLEYYKRAQIFNGQNRNGPRRRELRINQPDTLEVLSRTLHNPKHRHNAPITRSTLPIRKRLLTDWARKFNPGSDKRVVRSGYD